MTDWDETTRVTVGQVSLELPAALVQSAGAPIDSAAAVFEGGGLTVIVDQGPFADRLDAHAGRPDLREETREVAGATARTVFFRDPEHNTYTVGIHVPAPHYLTVVIQADAAVPEHVAHAIIDSVRLPK
jgi:catechol 2,3-dioxygenase-like lactoylglutathione lyase family enzyme